MSLGKLILTGALAVSAVSSTGEPDGTIHRITVAPHCEPRNNILNIDLIEQSIGERVAKACMGIAMDPSEEVKNSVQRARIFILESGRWVYDKGTL